MGSHKKSRKRSPSSDSSGDDDEGSSDKRRKDKSRSHSSSKKKSSKRSRKHVSASESSSNSDSEQERRELKKLKKAKKKAKKEKKKEDTTSSEVAPSSDIPLDLMTKSKAMAPLTKEEWEKKQSVVRRVYDESTGRHRLIKGDGEVVEEIVSRDRHKAINQQATRGDGDFFQAQVGWAIKK